MDVKSRLTVAAYTLVWGICLLCVPVAAGQSPPMQRSPEGIGRAKNTSYTLVGVEDVSYLGVKRIGAKIIIPLGRTTAEVRATLVRAAEEVARREGAAAVMVHAIRPQDDPDSACTVGRATYAPNGQWSDAGKSGPMRTEVVIGKLYFKIDDPRHRPTKGQQVKLKTSLSPAGIWISSRWDRWTDDVIIATVRKGTKAVILERRSAPSGYDDELVRYLVRVKYRGNTIKGWVDDFNVDCPQMDLQKADELLGEKRYTAAAEAYTAICDAYPDTQTAKEAAARLDEMRADREIGKFVKRATEQHRKEAQKKAASYLSMARSCRAARTYGVARKYYQRVIDEFPDTEEAAIAKREVADLPE